MINLLDLAPRGRWQAGKLVDEHNVTDVENLPWNGSASDNKGFVRLLDRARCEDGDVHRVLETHPRWVSRGTIKGWLPWETLPDNAIFRAQVGFLDGARGTDGVTFQVWEHHHSRGREVWNRLIDYQKPYSGSLTFLEADLSHLSGQSAGIELRVDAGSSSDKDWAVWVEPRIDTRPGLPARIWTLKPETLTINDKNEGSGDEPYLGAIYFRSIFGKPGTTKVAVLDKLHTLGSNLGTGSVVAIPEAAKLSVSDVAVTWEAADLTALGHGIGVMGLQFIAMESDLHGKGVVRDKLRDKGRRLFDELKRHIESNALAILHHERTISAIEREVSDSGRRSFLDDIASVIGVVFRWFTDADDPIAQNGILLIGLSEAILRERVGDAYRPTERLNPMSALTNRNFDLEFRGDSTRYTVRVELRQTSAEVTV